MAGFTSDLPLNSDGSLAPQPVETAAINVVVSDASISEIVQNMIVKEARSGGVAPSTMSARSIRFELASAEDSARHFKRTDSVTESATSNDSNRPVPVSDKATPKAQHYVLLWTGSSVQEQVENNHLFENNVFDGVQMRYLWSDLEPTLGKYDFASISKDVAYVASIKKKLIVQLDHVKWASEEFGFPKYLDDNRYAGGYFRRESGVAIPKQYNRAVSERFQALLIALGREFSNAPNVEAMVLDETSLGVKDATNRADIKDYYPVAYKNEIVAQMLAARKAFPHTQVIQYVNYLDRAPQLLDEIVRVATANGIGVGGPDLRPFDAKAYAAHYRLYAQTVGKTPRGTAIQWANYEYRSPKTGARVSVRDMISYGQDELKLTYFSWSMRRPYFTDDVLPTLQALKAESDSTTGDRAGKK